MDSLKQKRRSFGAIIAVVFVTFVSSMACTTQSDSLDYYNSLTVGEPDLSAKHDGVYYGEYTVHPPFGVLVANPHVEVRVDIETQCYKDISIVVPARWNSLEFILRLKERILKDQSMEAVDAVSGATTNIGYTGKAYLKAIEAALQ